jgi:hypothetical protein
MAPDPVGAEALIQAERLERRAAQTGDENDVRASTLLRVLYGLIQAGELAKASINRRRLYRSLSELRRH